jgi:hypothetical protein
LCAPSCLQLLFDKVSQLVIHVSDQIGEYLI